MPRARISPHFSAAEFDCHNGEQWPPAARAAIERLALDVFEPMRRRFGPIRVTSAYRPEAYNRSVGGAPSSFHRYELRYPGRPGSPYGVGVAADVVPARGTPHDWMVWALARFDALPAEKWGRRGAAVAYPASGFVHVDSGPRRSWAG